MAAPGNVAAGSVQCMWPLVAKAVSLEPKNTFVIPRRVPCLKGRHITDLSRTKTEEAKEGNASRKPTESLLSELGAPCWILKYACKSMMRELRVHIKNDNHN